MKKSDVAVNIGPRPTPTPQRPLPQPLQPRPNQFAGAEKSNGSIVAYTMNRPQSSNNAVRKDGRDIKCCAHVFGSI